MQLRGAPIRRGGTLLLLGTLCLLAAATPAQAGHGHIDRVKGTIDLVVYFSYPATVEEMRQWEPVLTEFSKGLYEATEGGLRLGKVSLTTDPSESKTADMWISNIQDEDEPATATHYGWGQDTAALFMHQIHKCSGVNTRLLDFTPAEVAKSLGVDLEEAKAIHDRARAIVGHAPDCNANWRGQFGMLHEAGHYFWGLADEYEGCTSEDAEGDLKTCADGAAKAENPSSGDRKYFCGIGDGAKGCVMDGGTRDAVRNTRSEFCVDLPKGAIASTENEMMFGHLGGYALGGQFYESKQQRFHGHACWTTIFSVGTKLNATTDVLDSSVSPRRQRLLFFQKPTTYPVEQRELRVDELPTFSILGAPKEAEEEGPGPAFVVLLDQSTSMLVGAPGIDVEPFAAAKQGVANAVLSTLRDNEWLGIVSFHGVGVSLLPAGLARMGTQEERTLVATDVLALQSVRTGVAGTSLTKALSAAMEVFGSQAQEDVAGKHVILITDGQGAIDSGPSSTVNRLAAAGIRIHTVAIGELPNRRRLASMAATTGGYAADASTTPDIDEAVQRIIEDARGSTLGAFETLNLAFSPPASPPLSTDVLVPDFARSVDFIVSHAAGAPIEVSLLSPRGIRYAFDEAEDAVCTLDTLTAGAVKQCGATDVQYLPNAASAPSQQLFRVPNPEAGVWSVETRVTIDDGASHQVTVRSNFDAPIFRISADVTNPDPLTFPTPIRIVVPVVVQVPVTEVSVTARVTHPIDKNSPEQPPFSEDITLFDDGLAEHGDDQAGDGRYSALYANYRDGGNGVYTFDVEVLNEGMAGRTVSENREWSPNPAPPRAIADFRALVTVTVEVTGVPDTIVQGTLAITTDQLTQGYQYTVSQMNVAPALVFKVRADDEAMKLLSITIVGDNPDDQWQVGTVGLYADDNFDGRLDNRSDALATGTYIQGETDLTFRKFDQDDEPAMLAMVLAGQERQFVVTYGRIWGPEISTLTASFGRVPSKPVGAPPFPILWLAATMAAVVFASQRMANRSLARPLAVLSSVALLVLVTGAVGCGSSGGGSGTIIGADGPRSASVNPLPTGAYPVRLERDDIVVRGATTGTLVSATGEATNGTVQVVADP